MKLRNRVFLLLSAALVSCSPSSGDEQEMFMSVEPERASAPVIEKQELNISPELAEIFEILTPEENLPAERDDLVKAVLPEVSIDEFSSETEVVNFTASEMKKSEVMSLLKETPVGVMADSADSKRDGLSCLSFGREIEMPEFVASSIQMIGLKQGKTAIFYEDVEGRAGVISVGQNDVERHDLSLHGQIACVGTWGHGVRYGLIERDAKSGAYTIQFQVMDETWKLKKREGWKGGGQSFSVFPGSRCIIDGKGEAFVVGYKERYGKPPYHGVFKTEKKKVALVLPGEHPILTDRLSDKEVLGRVVVREGDEASRWADVIYIDDEKGKLSEKEREDFIVRYEDNVRKFDKYGCMKSGDGQQAECSLKEELNEVIALPGMCTDGECYQLVMKENTKIARYLKGKVVDVYDIENNIRLLSTKEDGVWRLFSYKMHSLKPDVGSGLREMSVKPGCQPGEN